MVETYIRDFWDVLKRRTFRLGHSVTVLNFFDLPQDGSVPPINNRADRHTLAEKIRDGENAAVAAGYPAMSNPSMAEVIAKLNAAVAEAAQITPKSRVAWIVGMRVSAPYRHFREFKSKLPFFQKVISESQASETPPSTSFIRVPVPADARCMAYSILAQRLADGRLAVEFVTYRGFPNKHRGFLFLSSGSIEDFPKMASRWPRRTPLQDNWLYIAD